MRDFLTGWKSGLQPYQAQILEAWLKDKQVSGEISTQEEMDKVAQALALEIKQRPNEPLFKVIPIDYQERVDAEVQNYYVNTVYNDLAVVYKELDDIWRTIQAHKEYFSSNILPNMSKQVSVLESQLSTYELLVGLGEGYNYLAFNDFKDSSNRQTRLSSTTSLFTDPKTGAVLGKEFDSEIIADTKMLVLPAIESSGANKVKINNVSLNANYTSGGSLGDSYGPQNLVNAANGLDWRYDIVYYYLPNHDITLGLNFKLAGTKRINSFSLTPLVDGPTISINQILYLSGGSNPVEVALVDNSLLGQELHQPTTFFFEAIYASELIVVFKQNTPFGAVLGNTSTQQSIKDSSWDQPSKNDSIFNNNSLNEGYQGSIKSKPGMTGANSLSINTNTLKNMKVQKIGAGSAAYNYVDATNVYMGVYKINNSINQIEYKNNEVNIFVYQFGSTNLRVEFKDFQNRGIYVSNSVEVPMLGKLALSTVEQINNISVNQLETAGDIEYYINKEDFNQDGTSLGSVLLPILPLNETYVVAERVLPSEGGLATLQFCASILKDGTMTHDIKVYRNGLELTEGNDWSVWKETLDKKTQILISGIAGNFGGLNDVYTVQYYPNFTLYNHLESGLAFDTIGDEVVYYSDNVAQTSWYRQNNVIEFSPVYKSLVTLVIVLRNLTLDRTQTPILKQYKLMMAGIPFV